MASSTSSCHDTFVVGSAGTPAAPGLVSELEEDEDDVELSTEMAG